MTRKLIFSLVACLVLFAGARDVPGAMAAQATPAHEIIQLVNELRTAHGLPPYQINGILMTAAQNHANWMAGNVISHTGAGGSTPQSRAAAAGYAGYVTENIVGGTNMTPRQGFIWWQNSPVHLNTLVSTRYAEVGVGFTSSGRQNFYVLVAGSTSSRPAAQRPATAPEPLIVTPIRLAQPREDGSIVHVVQPGQALWSLAAHYEVRLADLLLINNLTENAIVHPGNEIIIRLAEGQEPPPTPTPPLTHVVREGQTLWGIAGLHGVRLADLLWFNGLDEDAILHPGNEIKIRLAPGEEPPPTPTPITVHVVRSGQTLWDIALTYGLTLDQLLAYNGLSADTIIHPGNELVIRPTETPSPTEVVPTDTPTAPPTEAATSSPTPTLTPQPRPTVTPTSSPVPNPSTAATALMLEPAGTLLVILLLVLVVAAAAVAAMSRKRR